MAFPSPYRTEGVKLFKIIKFLWSKYLCEKLKRFLSLVKLPDDAVKARSRYIIYINTEPNWLL